MNASADSKQHIGTNGSFSPGVALWDANGVAVGFKRGFRQTIKENGYYDGEIGHFRHAKKVKPEYMSLSDGGNDGICIAQIDVVVSRMRFYSMITLHGS